MGCGLLWVGDQIRMKERAYMLSLGRSQQEQAIEKSSLQLVPIDFGQNSRTMTAGLATVSSLFCVVGASCWFHFSNKSYLAYCISFLLHLASNVAWAQMALLGTLLHIVHQFSPCLQLCPSFRWAQLLRLTQWPPEMDQWPAHHPVGAWALIWTSAAPAGQSRLLHLTILWSLIGDSDHMKSNY